MSPLNNSSSNDDDVLEIAHGLGIAAPAHRRVDPDLLELNGIRCPRRGLGLEEDRVLFAPEPRAPLDDLRAGAPAEALGVVLERIDPELGSTTPVSMLIMVDLPAPFGPISSVIAPRLALKLRLLRIMKSP